MDIQKLLLKIQCNHLVLVYIHTFKGYFTSKCSFGKAEMNYSNHFCLIKFPIHKRQDTTFESAHIRFQVIRTPTMVTGYVKQYNVIPNIPIILTVCSYHHNLIH